MAVREAGSPTENIRTAQLTPRTSGTILKQPTISWKAQDKYNKLHNSEIEVKNIVLTNSYDMQESKKVPIIMNWQAVNDQFCPNIK